MTGFREQMKRYRNGTASPEEKQAVEEAIEKYETLEEYELEQLERRMPSGEEAVPLPEFQADETEIRGLKKSVNRKIRRAVAGTLFIAAVVGAALFALCQAFFYNPNRGIAETYGGDGQFAIDAAVFTELHSPGYSTNWAKAVSDGPGSYQLYLRQIRYFTGEQSDLSCRLVRGRVLGMEKHPGAYIPGAVNRPENILENYWRFPAPNVLWMKNQRYSQEDENGVERFEQLPEELQSQKEALKELPESAWVSSYITFKEDMTLKEFETLYREWCVEGKNLDIVYAAVRCMDEMGDIMGFSPYGGGVWLEPGTVPEDRYPYLYLNLGDGQGDNRAEIWEAHYKSLLSYLSQRPSFLKAMANVNGIDAEKYKYNLYYIEENGIHIYGVLLQGRADTVLQFASLEGVDGIDVEDVKISVLAH